MPTSHSSNRRPEYTLSPDSADAIVHARRGNVLVSAGRTENYRDRGVIINFQQVYMLTSRLADEFYFLTNGQFKLERDSGGTIVASRGLDVINDPRHSGGPPEVEYIANVLSVLLRDY